MSELETLIAVAGTLGGTVAGVVVTYLLNERSEARRAARDVALTPLKDKQSALKATYNSLVDCMVVMVEEWRNPQRDRDKLRAEWNKFELSFARGALWYSVREGPEIYSGLKRMRVVERKLESGSKMSKEDNDEFNTAFTIVGKAIGRDLGLSILDSQLQTILLEYLP